MISNRPNSTSAANAVPTSRALTVALLVLGVSLALPGAASVLDHRGDTSFYSAEVRTFESFPTLESVIPMPVNINPFNRKKVRESCVLNTIRGNKAARGAKGTFTARLVVLDGLSKRYRTVELASGKFKTDVGGQAEMTFDIPTDLFAEGFKDGEIAAWSHTAVEFTKRKGTFVLLRCDITARK